jgi:hypothetical protein
MPSKTMSFSGRLSTKQRLERQQGLNSLLSELIARDLSIPSIEFIEAFLQVRWIEQ